MIATKAAVEAFTIGYGNPGTEQANKAYVQRAKHYDLYWAFYENSIFDNMAGDWAKFRTQYGLYRYTQAIFNPTGRLVEFYARQIYPGLLLADQSSVSKDVPIAMPFSDKTPQALRDAIGQLWQWSNFQTWKTVIPRWGAALGNCFVEVVDDIESGKVYFDVIWPGHVIDIKLDSRGNVTSYTLEYKVTEEEPHQPGQIATTTSYIYRKEVDREEFRYFKDNHPHDYGSGSVVANPYGFVPAVWYIHNSVGGTFGRPAIHRSLSKISYLNSTMSQIGDRVGRSINTPMVVTSGLTGFKPAFDDLGTGKTKRKMAEPDDYGSGNSQLGRELAQLYVAPQGTAVHPLIGELDVAKAMIAVDKMLDEIASDHQEITYWDKLREMSTVTGPAAKMLSGDIIATLFDTQAIYDQQTIKLFQMAVAIGGMRSTDGSWGGSLTPQQDKFRPFALESYGQGALDFNFKHRDLVEPTDMETAQIEQSQWTTVGIKQQEGVPFEIAARGLLSPQDMKTTLAEKEANKLKAEQIANQQPAQQPNNIANQNLVGDISPNNTDNGGNI